MTSASSTQVHLSRESAPFNSLPLSGSAGVPWADQVACLTDLQAAGFDHQAEDLLQHLLTQRGIA